MIVREQGRIVILTDKKNDLEKKLEDMTEKYKIAEKSLEEFTRKAIKFEYESTDLR